MYVTAASYVSIVGPSKITNDSIASRKRSIYISLGIRTTSDVRSKEREVGVLLGKQDTEPQSRPPRGPVPNALGWIWEGPL